MLKLAATIDYCKIDIDKAILRPIATDILDGYCSTAFNPALVQNASYALIGSNTVNGTFNGTEAKGVQTTLSNVIEHDCPGYYGVACRGPNYKYKFNQRRHWTVGDFSAGYNWGQVSAARRSSQLQAADGVPWPCGLPISAFSSRMLKSLVSCMRSRIVAPIGKVRWRILLITGGATSRARDRAASFFKPSLAMIASSKLSGV